MTEKTVFLTPGELDLKALTTFGLNSKPNTTNPIGFFGTGLKYAIAVLARKGIPVTIFIGMNEYIFYIRKGEFRTKEVNYIMCKSRTKLFGRWRYEELPFTTDLGKTWELWQAFRELEANTRDEGGYTFVANDIDNITGGIETTRIIVCSDEFAAIYADRNKIFLATDMFECIEKTPQIAVYKAPSKHIYYRGMRVLDLDKPTIYTYNILSALELTEDRTAKYSYQIHQAIANWTVQAHNSQAIAAIVGADNQVHFEGKLDFDYGYSSPSDEFLEVINKRRRRNSRLLSPSAVRFYDRYAPTPVVLEPSLWERLEEMLNNRTEEWLPHEISLLNEIVLTLKEHNL